MVLLTVVVVVGPIEGIHLLPMMMMTATTTAAMWWMKSLWPFFPSLPFFLFFSAILFSVLPFYSVRITEFNFRSTLQTLRTLRYRTTGPWDHSQTVSGKNFNFFLFLLQLENWAVCRPKSETIARKNVQFYTLWRQRWRRCYTRRLYGDQWKFWNYAFAHMVDRQILCDKRTALNTMAMAK